MPREHERRAAEQVALAESVPDVSHLTGLDLAHVLGAAAKRGEDLQLYDLSHIPEPTEDGYDSANNPLCGDCLYPGCQGCDK